MIKIIHKNGWLNARHVVSMDNCTFSVVQVDQGKIVVNFTVFLHVHTALFSESVWAKGSCKKNGEIYIIIQFMVNIFTSYICTSYIFSLPLSFSFFLSLSLTLSLALETVILSVFSQRQLQAIDHCNVWRTWPLLRRISLLVQVRDVRVPLCSISTVDTGCGTSSVLEEALEVPSDSDGFFGLFDKRTGPCPLRWQDRVFVMLQVMRSTLICSIPYPEGQRVEQHGTCPWLALNPLWARSTHSCRSVQKPVFDKLCVCLCVKHLNRCKASKIWRGWSVQMFPTKTDPSHPRPPNVFRPRWRRKSSRRARVQLQQRQQARYGVATHRNLVKLSATNWEDQPVFCATIMFFNSRCRFFIAKIMVLSLIIWLSKDM